MNRFTACSLLTGALLLSSAGAKAEGDAPRPNLGGPLLLAEIVASEPSADNVRKTAPSAADARVKARAHREHRAGSPTVVIEPEEEEEGMLGPRRIPESSASQAVTKARQYQQGPVTTKIQVSNALESGSEAATTAERAQENRVRARSYVSGDNTIVIERIGSDGIPIVACGKLVDNVAGRIGDDVQPGGVFLVVRDNKSFKVRCAQ